MWPWPTRRCRWSGARPDESYLRGDAIIAAARATGAQAVHPGYGFLSENPDFVEALEDAGLVFIGPSAKAIRSMGLKGAAKALMEEAGVPVVPGYHGAEQSEAHLAAEAERIGYPVLLKAVAGAAARGCAASMRPPRSRRRWLRPRPRPRAPSAMTRCWWRNTSSARATWRCRSSATAPARCICSNVTVPCNGATRR